jgi:hypothetical protein
MRRIRKPPRPGLSSFRICKQKFERCMWYLPRDYQRNQEPVGTRSRESIHSSSVQGAAGSRYCTDLFTDGRTCLRTKWLLSSSWRRTRRRIVGTSLLTFWVASILNWVPSKNLVSWWSYFTPVCKSQSAKRKHMELWKSSQLPEFFRDTSNFRVA